MAVEDIVAEDQAPGSPATNSSPDQEGLGQALGLGLLGIAS